MIYEYQDIIGDRFERYKQLRADKRFEESDELRCELEKMGFEIRDTDTISMIVKNYFPSHHDI